MWSAKGRVIKKVYGSRNNICQQNGGNMKKQKSVIAVYIILFILYSVIFFAVPFHKGETAWIAYVFSVIALVFSCVITIYSFSKSDDLRSKVYGFPVFRIGYIYLAVQMILGVILFVIGTFIDVPTWISVVTSIVLLGLALIGVIATDNARDIIEDEEESVAVKTQKMTYFRLDVEGLLEGCQDKELRKSLEHLLEEVRYSDPVSSEELKENEQRLTDTTSKLREEIFAGKVDDAKKTVELVEGLLADRNRRCKAGK